ncbi:hypothetical protein [Thalassospira sp.]|uniref:hypothetical protein n=1 Tax=Thalassospira sp. TaxID=1912094 RepID=UPI000C4E05AE|nr:hypothetical protein [Thalassospira sp.]MBC05406.1 hypothetical protein [Thalassospira sp.]|tara:strand:- start:6367 stop:8406 length:2040 start_codon:yes stop_codon:yes gene_type:complete
MPNIGIQNPVAHQLGGMENVEARHNVSLAGMKLEVAPPPQGRAANAGQAGAPTSLADRILKHIPGTKVRAQYLVQKNTTELRNNIGALVKELANPDNKTPPNMSAIAKSVDSLLKSGQPLQNILQNAMINSMEELSRDGVQHLSQKLALVSSQDRISDAQDTDLAKAGAKDVLALLASNAQTASTMVTAESATRSMQNVTRDLAANKPLADILPSMMEAAKLLRDVPENANGADQAYLDMVDGAKGQMIEQLVARMENDLDGLDMPATAMLRAFSGEIGMSSEQRQPIKDHAKTFADAAIDSAKTLLDTAMDSITAENGDISDAFGKFIDASRKFGEYALATNAGADDMATVSSDMIDNLFAGMTREQQTSFIEQFPPTKWENLGIEAFDLTGQYSMLSEVNSSGVTMVDPYQGPAANSQLIGSNVFLKIATSLNDIVKENEIAIPEDADTSVSDAEKAALQRACGFAFGKDNAATHIRLTQEGSEHILLEKAFQFDPQNLGDVAVGEQFSKDFIQRGTVQIEGLQVNIARDDETTTDMAERVHNQLSGMGQADSTALKTLTSVVHQGMLMDILNVDDYGLPFEKFDEGSLMLGGGAFSQNINIRFAEDGTVSADVSVFRRFTEEQNSVQLLGSDGNLAIKNLDPNASEYGVTFSVSVSGTDISITRPLEITQKLVEVN